MLLYNNRKAHLFSLSDVPIYNSILILLQAPPVTVYKPLFFYVSSTILMTAYILLGFRLLWHYSNSIVPGGLLVRSYITRFTPFTSFMILVITFCSTSNGISEQSAVMKSLVLTARSAIA